MSQENVEFVRSIYVAQARGDFIRADWADPEIEYEHMDGPSPGVAKGLGEMARMWRRVLSTFDELQITATEFREIDHERVFVLTESRGTAKRSHVPVPEGWTRGAAVYRVRDGKVVGLQIYFDPEHALADLGLEE
jgi:hypothetical protein